jgi:hypothetical protein
MGGAKWCRKLDKPVLKVHTPASFLLAATVLTRIFYGILGSLCFDTLDMESFS